MLRTPPSSDRSRRSSPSRRTWNAPRWRPPRSSGSSSAASPGPDRRGLGARERGDGARPSDRRRLLTQLHPDPATEPAPVAEEPAAPVAIEEEPAETILTGGGPVSLSSATFDDLRKLGLSVTQAKRILDFRDRLGGRLRGGPGLRTGLPQVTPR